MNGALLIVAFALVTLSNATVADDSQPSLTAAQKCNEFCDQLFAADSEDCARCKEGCSEAELCVERCTQRFNGDDEKLDRCRYRCARAR